MVERILGKAEVGSSILPGGTMGAQSKFKALGPRQFSDIDGAWSPFPDARARQRLRLPRGGGADRRFRADMVWMFMASLGPALIGRGFQDRAVQQG